LYFLKNETVKQFKNGLPAFRSNAAALLQGSTLQAA